jgi:hypothetical protein
MLGWLIPYFFGGTAPSGPTEIRWMHETLTAAGLAHETLTSAAIATETVS